MKIVLRLLIAVFVIAAGRAPADAIGSPAPVTDPAQVAHHFQEVVSRPEFQEATEPDTGGALRNWLSQWFTRAFVDFGRLEGAQEMPRFASMLMTIFVLLSLAGLLYTLVRFLRHRRILVIRESPQMSGPQALRPPEFYDEEIRRAVAAGNWPAAWLASWRQFLSRLEKVHLVEADRSRTNREYLAQLQRQPLPGPAFPLLQRMVDAYDRFIYGCRPIGESEWTFFHEQVNEATLLLHLREARAAESAPAKTP